LKKSSCLPKGFGRAKKIWPSQKDLAMRTHTRSFSVKRIARIGVVLKGYEAGRIKVEGDVVVEAGVFNGN